MRSSSAGITVWSRGEQENVIKPTNTRLIDALLDLWADAPVDDVSVRAVVQHASAAQSSIHYYFGDMERLYLAASRSALSQGQAWMGTRLAQLGRLDGEPLPAGLQASLIASTIADWTGGERRIAMAWRHAADAEWQAAWDGFWSDMASMIGLHEHADALACFAAGESARHLLVWNPPLDRALLDETVAAFTLWLRERRQSADCVRTAYCALARGNYDMPAPHPDVQAAQVADAAAALLAEKGHAGVTFRSVAARAGVTLGKVIHVYGTKSVLLHAALHGLYEREALRGDLEQLRAHRIAPGPMLERVLEAVLGGSQPVLAAYDEIERAIYNGPDHAALRGLVRAMDDPSGTWALQQMLGGTEPSASLVAAFSAVIRGVGYRALHSDGAQGDLRSGAMAALEPFVG